MPNLLTAQAGLKLGPIVLETFFKHYLERIPDSKKTEGSDLREQDLFWREAFEIVKSFLNQATKHTVEELQEFSNARIPVPPWIYVHRVLIPLSTCDIAASHLIKALGGEDVADRVVGGTKWWQVRGIRGVDCQWIWQKSHVQSARSRSKTAENGGDSLNPPNPRFASTVRKLSNNWGNSRSSKHNNTRDSEHPSTDQNEEETHQENLAGMDGTRCMLYAHGGGYYFGSIDQERYCMQRYARKMHGRVFAVNYRLSPQYPFPCAIQDLLAAYLYLIEPPPDAHAPIPPSSIVLAGDSAGGGLCLAVLQVIRDSGLPLPSAAILISPWCDLTHSFPSTIQNTSTDIIPPYGLCLHKPSVLWPPPPGELSSKVRAGLRARFKQVAIRAVQNEALSLSQREQVEVRIGGTNELAQGTTLIEEIDAVRTTSSSPSEYSDDVNQEAPDTPNPDNDTNAPVYNTYNPTSKHSEAEALPISGKLPLPWENLDAFDMVVDGETITIDKQIQLYCPNSLLVHPLISPALGYLGGLPPLLIIASDKEVLRDEIIYVAHKAAHPDRFPINESAKKLYPPLQDIRSEPTPVHLQVYDETAHVLPLFSFTTPAKYCYRAIALFAKTFALSPDSTAPSLPLLATPEHEHLPTLAPQREQSQSSTLSPFPSGIHPLSSLRKSASASLFTASPLSRSRSSLFRRRSLSPAKFTAVDMDPPGDRDVNREGSGDSGDVAGNRFKSEEEPPSQGPGTAGDPSVYEKIELSKPFMIRERVSTSGVIRPLEPESELPALSVPADHIGIINEGVARRYRTGQDLWAKKFGKTAKKIEALRKKNLELAKGEAMKTVKSLAQLQEHLFRELEKVDVPSPDKKATKKPSNLSQRAKESFKGKMDHDSERNTWTWAWALDGERPPASSIVSRRDTVEARSLARVADISVGQEESKLSGNMLWSVLVNFLTAQPHHKRDEEVEETEEAGGQVPARENNEGPSVVVSSKRSRIIQRFKSLGRSSGRPRESDTPRHLSNSRFTN